MRYRNEFQTNEGEVISAVSPKRTVSPPRLVEQSEKSEGKRATRFEIPWFFAEETIVDSVEIAVIRIVQSRNLALCSIRKIGHFFITSRDCGGTGTSANPPPTTTKPPSTQFQQVIAAAQPGSITEIARARKFFVVSNDVSIKSKISSSMIKALPQMQAASTEQEADFFIGFELTDRTTGLVIPNDDRNPNLRGELIVFTVIPATINRTENIRILFRVTRERGFGVFSATPDENATKEFAKQLAKIIT